MEFQLKFLVFWVFLLSVLSLCHGKNVTVSIIGNLHCADCIRNEFSSSQASSGINVHIRCKSENRETNTEGNGAVDREGKFNVTLSAKITEKGYSIDGCFAKLQSESAASCPIQSVQTATVNLLSTEKNATLAAHNKPSLIKFSPITCQSAFFWPFIKPNFTFFPTPRQMGSPPPPLALPPPPAPQVQPPLPPVENVNPPPAPASAPSYLPQIPSFPPTPEFETPSPQPYLNFKTPPPAGSTVQTPQNPIFKNSPPPSIPIYNIPPALPPQVPISAPPPRLAQYPYLPPPPLPKLEKPTPPPSPIGISNPPNYGMRNPIPRAPPVPLLPPIPTVPRKYFNPPKSESQPPHSSTPSHS